MTTTIEEDEILAAVQVPAAKSGQGSAYVKFSHPASRYAVIGAAALITVSGGACSAVSTAIGGLVTHAQRLKSVEGKLTGQTISDTSLTAAVAEVSADLSDVMGDIYASAEYRREVAPVYVKRALREAAARAVRS
jgi:carbon-monoxide dehydrogenase medium subunit